MQRENLLLSIGARIQQVVDMSGLKPKVFAAEVGIPYSTFHNYLKDEREPGASAIAKICTQKQIDANWLLTGSGEMQRAQSVACESSFDGGLLSDIIEAIEDMCASDGVTLPARKKAEVILLLYDYFRADRKVERPTVARFLRLVA